jgi:hypothetical protein
LLDALVSGFPALGAPTGWNVRFGRELNATDDRADFGAVGLPVVDGKHLQPFHLDLGPVSRRILARTAAARLPDRRFERARLGYRDVSGVSNRLSLIAAIVPGGVVATHTVFTLRSVVTDDAQQVLCAVFNSYVLNAIVRMLMGGHVTTTLVESLPVPVLTGGAAERRLARWSRRLSTRPADRVTEARLQAEVAALYGIRAPELRRILEGFPLVAPGQRDLAARALERRSRS